MSDLLAQVKSLAAQYPKFCQILTMGPNGAVTLVIISLGHNWSYPYAGITWSEKSGLDVRIHDSSLVVPDELTELLSEARRLLLVQKGVIPGVQKSIDEDSRTTCSPMPVAPQVLESST